jgi:glycosyltransferase involved in cell wall biosynthesis
MALATALGLRDKFETHFVAPAGPVHEELARNGFRSTVFTGARRFCQEIRPVFAGHRRVVSIGTRVLHTAAAELWARMYGVRCANIQVVHGGANEHLSYGRKRWLNRLGVKQVAVSNYVRERMLAHGADGGAIRVIENFLSPERVQETLRVHRRPFELLRRVAIVSRLDPIKRIDLLLDALDLDAGLRTIQFEIYGDGEDAQVLQTRALAKHPNVHFLGFRSDAAQRLGDADLLLHLCPEEPFGLAILEGMAAGLAVLVPNQGGAGSLVEDGRSGFHFRANDAQALASKLHSLQRMPVQSVRQVIAEGMRSLRTRFSAECGVAQYRRLIEECLQ